MVTRGHSMIMMRINLRKLRNSNCVQTATESYMQVTIRCTSTKSMVKLGSKSAAAKAASCGCCGRYSPVYAHKTYTWYLNVVVFNDVHILAQNFPEWAKLCMASLFM